MTASLLSGRAIVLATDFAQIIEADISGAPPHLAEGFLDYVNHNDINNDTTLSRGAFEI